MSISHITLQQLNPPSSLKFLVGFVHDVWVSTRVCFSKERGQVGTTSGDTYAKLLESVDHSFMNMGLVSNSPQNLSQASRSILGLLFNLSSYNNMQSALKFRDWMSANLSRRQYRLPHSRAVLHFPGISVSTKGDPMIAINMAVTYIEQGNTFHSSLGIFYLVPDPTLAHTTRSMSATSTATWSRPRERLTS